MVEGAVMVQVEGLLERYARDLRAGNQRGVGATQLQLPLTQDAKHLPDGFFPISPFELCQKHSDLCALYPMSGLEKTVDRGMVLAKLEHNCDHRGRSRAIIYVHPEHMDEQGDLTSQGRFAALRELARLIAVPFGVPYGTPLTTDNCTAETHAGNFLQPGFFGDPLNRWAMELGCPQGELETILRKQWGSTPVTREMVAPVRPMFAEHRLGMESAFFEVRYQESEIGSIFGLDKHAVLGWARYCRLVGT
jgi:hypothetical protein